MELGLRADGISTAPCVFGRACTTFYYGVDGGGEYRRVDLRADGEGVGSFIFVFGLGTVPSGDVDAIPLFETEERLSFDLWNIGLDGRLRPIHFELTR